MTMGRCTDAEAKVDACTTVNPFRHLFTMGTELSRDFELNAIERDNMRSTLFAPSDE